MNERPNYLPDSVHPRYFSDDERRSRGAADVKHLREIADIRRGAFAAYLETSPDELDRIESGDQYPSLAILHKIADAFNTSIDELTGRMSLRGMGSNELLSAQTHVMNALRNMHAPPQLMNSDGNDDVASQFFAKKLRP